MTELVYSRNKLCRTSYPVYSDNAKPLIETIQKNFPEQSEFIFTAPKNHIGTTTIGYRAPYVGGEIGLYSFIPLPQNYIEEYNVDVNVFDLLPFFGLKFNIETKEVILKIMFRSKDFTSKLELPGKPSGSLTNGDKIFYGLMFKKNKGIHEELDCYMNRLNKDYPSYSSVLKYCQDNGLEMPTEDATIINNTSMWSIVFDYNNLLKPKIVKMYSFIFDIVRPK